MGNVRPFWRAIERERLGTGHSLAMRRHRLYQRRLGIRHESVAAERRRESQQVKLAPKEKKGFFGRAAGALRRLFSNGKKGK